MGDFPKDSLEIDPSCPNETTVFVSLKGKRERVYIRHNVKNNELESRQQKHSDAKQQILPF